MPYFPIPFSFSWSLSFQCSQDWTCFILSSNIEYKILHLIFLFRKEMSAYYLENAGVHHVQKHFDLFEEEARSLLSSGLAIPAYDMLVISHAC